MLLSLTSGGFVCKIGKQEGCFWKKGYKWRGSLIKWEEREGLKAKWPLIPFLPMRNRGGGQGRRRWPIRPLRASGAAGTEGKRERGLRGIDPLPHLELRWRTEAARRKRAAVGGRVRGGGAAAAREEAGGGCDGLGCGGATPRPFYSSSMAVERAG